MLQAERRNNIIQELHIDGTVHIEQLASKFKVSAMTIRRDLAALEKEGQLVRSHGGAVLPESMAQEVPYQTKLSSFKEEKEQIAKKAVELVPENSRILLDSGTTNLEIAKLLKSRRDLVIVTNDAKISMELLHSESTVISTGGELQKDIGAFIGTHVQEMLRNIKVDVVFLGANAVDLTDGISTPSMEKAYIKKLMVRSARAKWVIADHSKFNKQAFAHVCTFDEVNGIITDDQIDDQTRQQLEKETNVY
ncbi:DeoR family regulatory proteins [Thalassobacillus devorans]|uniref:DeoR family regulatory proteins n=1 Tax=Thalassobacillus devorans TaxID=279813 RepID=A0ABQ1NSY4_9BACI|nr:DeoR/GlpR family DNA-binding transcription regulator [Thalassobacillus devorans]NIK28672.1 DeoR/GlpR family transcriptional regulator of sugar metabolism [Thalassobacillus devorans]GGC84433.1 DeoR family regulatory proteins [Thalassobacillus devorans]